MISICNSLLFLCQCLCMGFRQPNVCSRFTIKTEFRSKVYFNFSEAIKIKIWGIAQIYLLKIQEAASFRII